MLLSGRRRRVICRLSQACRAALGASVSENTRRSAREHRSQCRCVTQLARDRGERQRAVSQEDGPKRLASSGGTIHSQRHLPRRSAKDEFICAGASGSASQLDPAVRHRSSFDAVHDADFLNQMLYLDTKIFMVSLNLNYNDKMSMASSLRCACRFSIVNSPSSPPGGVHQISSSKDFFARPQSTFSGGRCAMCCPLKCCGSQRPASPLRSTIGWRTS